MPPDCDTCDPAGRIRLRAIKDRNVFGQMLDSSSIHHTVNMKLLLLASVICFATVLAVPANKEKREILPGDPRYGTDQHHHHHHHENEVQISKAIGGYVGSFSVPDTEKVQKDSFQVPKPTYGPPDHKPSNHINGDYVAPDNLIKDPIQVPSTSYGVPDIAQLNNNYLAPTIEDRKQTSLLKVTVPKIDAHLNHNVQVNGDYQPPSAEAPITSYGLPDVKTTISEPKFGIGVGVPQVKLTTKLSETQGFNQQPIDFGKLPSFTSFNTGSRLLPSYTSDPRSYVNTYHSLGSIPVKTIDHHVQVQVPQPYPIPVTKHVTYPVPVPQTVEVPKPYHVRVPYPVQVPVDRPYPVEVPRAVPYPVPHYIRTSVPVAQPQVLKHVINPVKANPIQTFFEDTASTFQDTISNLPNLPNFPQFTNPLQNFPNLLENFPNLSNFQNPFENFQLPSFPSFAPAQPTPAPEPPVAPAAPTESTAPAAPTGPEIGIGVPTANDAVTIENPTVKITKTSSVIATQPIPRQKYVQPIDDNGGYVY